MRMGDEIANSHFSEQDYADYYAELERETKTLEQLFINHSFSRESQYCGLEQEAWILNVDGYPVPENQYLIDSLKHALLSPELARFNIELNVTPRKLSNQGLSLMQSELKALWDLCDDQLAKKQLHMEMIGILPTVRDEELVVSNMSDMKRYRALNEQVLLSRGGKPLFLNIVGKEKLATEHSDVMLESAATSLQVHRQVEARNCTRYYNAAIALSAITVAISANAPFLFGKKLWEETRIPLFEQAVEVGGYGNTQHGPIRRVSFGSGYAQKSIFECFQENLAHYPVLLPVKLDSNSKKFPYLRMHNGTIWRWNRPIVGFDEDGTPHVRIEHRVMAAGPTIEDEMANTAFFYGLQEYYASQSTGLEEIIPFSVAKDNFYSAAQHGIKSNINWVNTETNESYKISIKKLIEKELLDHARFGLIKLGIDKYDIDHYLHIIKQRASTGQTGSAWMQAYYDNHTISMNELMNVYRQNRLTETPVHTWAL